MGSLVSSPKLPKTKTQVVYVPAVATTSTTTTDATTAQDTKTAQELAAENREAGLLSRDRSRYGTVATSFRGFLSPLDQNIKRKTLLGD